MEFEVVEPVNEIDKLTYKALQKANSVLNDSTISYTLQKNLYIDQLKKTIAEYPNSQYTPFAYQQLLMELYYRRSDEFDTYVYEMFSRYADQWASYCCYPVYYSNPTSKLYKNYIIQRPDIKSMI